MQIYLSSFQAEADIIGGLENMKSKFEKISEIKRLQEKEIKAFPVLTWIEGLKLKLVFKALDSS